MGTSLLHAEHLLDKEANDELSPEESLHLEEHLAACPACRFERRVRNDFRAEFAPPIFELGLEDDDVVPMPKARLWLWAVVVVLMAGAAGWFTERTFRSAPTPASISGATSLG